MTATLLLDEACIVLQPSLVRRLGSMHDAALLQQLHYWTPKGSAQHDGYRWVYKTYEEWGDEIGLSTKQVRQAINRLEEAGLVMSCQPEGHNRRKWYRIDYDHPFLAFDGTAQTGDSKCPNGQMQVPSRADGSAQSGASTTNKITTEITTENYSQTPSAPSAALEILDPIDAQRWDEARYLANLLADLIAENGSKRPTVSEKWIQTVERMIRIDGRTATQVESAMRWCQNDPFWRANIMSPDKLRKQYDRLRLQATREQHRAGPKGLSGVREFLATLESPLTGVEPNGG